MAKLWAERSQVPIPLGERQLFFLRTSILDRGLIHPSIQLVTKVLHGDKGGGGREVDNSYASSAEVKNEKNYTPNQPI